jgi:serine/threonine-protein kinase HipA
MIKRCPITYLPISDAQEYSSQGLKLLSPQLTQLHDLPFTSQELRREALNSADKLSIQGVQYKLSAKLNIKDERFELTNALGKYILKPQSDIYPHLPENEDLTMRMASCLGIEVPVHGMVYGSDGELTYFIKRFDRAGHKDKLPVEDFAQLSGSSRLTKYDYSMEKVVRILDQFCTFPQIEKHKLFIRTIFNYIVGNEDMHLKNFSLITRNGVVQLAPAYDFINSTLIIPKTKEELALPLNGKKNNLTHKDFIDYFAYQKLGLNERNVQNLFKSLEQQVPAWKTLIEISRLTADEKERYVQIVSKRLSLLL